MTRLELYENSIGDAGLIALAEALRTNKALKWLNLQQQQFGDAGVAALANSLAADTGGLETLVLRFNKVSTTSAVALAQALRTNSRLAGLALDNNMIGNEGGAALAAAVKENTVLTFMSVTKNGIDGSVTATITNELLDNKDPVLRAAKRAHLDTSRDEL